MIDHNAAIITEFRDNDGNVGGPFARATLLLLHHTGAKSGTERVNPLMYQKVEGGYAIFASKAGAPTNPAWFHNLRANPDTAVEVGTDTVAVAARVAGDDERNTIFERQKANFPQFGEYEKGTSRTTPVVVLEPRS
jgi:deazaflavin-dependent oxidoreductase (nitroreductase family)